MILFVLCSLPSDENLLNIEQYDLGSEFYINFNLLVKILLYSHIYLFSSPEPKAQGEVL